MTIKEVMREDFLDFVYKPYELYKQVSMSDIEKMIDGEKITVELKFGRVNDGEYILERKKGTLYFYRKGYFGKAIIYSKNGIEAVISDRNFQKGLIKCHATGVIAHTESFPRFFAKN
ncbi:hypothetical protein [Ruminococcus albus]|uniref:Uncharacterized protein n=1 Tax=Ruminococcus albus (strain ATCC 27210 / DSM 20455 / JCM 14654 / NCDO 2250 / 7) TaxID=697329 RepID=E6UJF9_RUMA7|nr:hypothetical protein [Ruminococcus albus]ADU23805.1 hypothetical protein Rumal_3343 [Ruminococcus albus 7 = DSM 20455]